MTAWVCATAENEIDAGDALGFGGVVGDGDGDGDADGDDDGDADGEDDGDADGRAEVVGVGDAVGDADVVGVGDGEGVFVGDGLGVGVKATTVIANVPAVVPPPWTTIVVEPVLRASMTAEPSGLTNTGVPTLEAARRFDDADAVADENVTIAAFPDRKTNGPE